MIEMTRLVRGSQDDDGDTSLPKPHSEASIKEEVPNSDVQKPPRRAIWLDSWSFEWITLTFSIACFVAICIVLWIYDGKVRPEMDHDLSLNTIISVLATGCKSALILVIGEAISQLKWLWFQNPTQAQSQLVGIQRFDAASRGPLGSLMIIIHHRARSLVSLGAAVIILLLAFDPFMQQILSYPVRPTVDTNTQASALAPQLREYIPTEATPDWESALALGYWSGQEFSVSPQCSSGNCTWDSFASVGICSQCADMTAIATLNCSLPDTTKDFNRTCGVSFTEGVGSDFTVVYRQGMEYQYPSLLIPYTMIWMPQDITKLNLPNYTFAGVKNPLWTNAYVEIGLHSGQASPSAPISDSMFIKSATGCSLSTCLRDYHVSMGNGHSSIQTSNVDFGTMYKNYSKPTFSAADIGVEDFDKELCWMPGPPAADGYQWTREFAFCDDNMRQLANSGQKFFPSGQEPANRVSWEWNDRTWKLQDEFLTTKPSANTIWLNEASNPLINRITIAGFNRTMANMAASLTKLGLEKTNGTVDGTVYVTKAFVSVRWPWIILPGLLVAIGAIFLVVTIAVTKTSSMPLWKSSALVPYYHGIERLGGNEDDANEYPTVSTMEKKAEEEYIQLQRSEENGRLVLREQRASSTSEPMLQST